jgi:hypothetical protein
MSSLCYNRPVFYSAVLSAGPAETADPTVPEAAPLELALAIAWVLLKFDIPGKAIEREEQKIFAVNNWGGLYNQLYCGEELEPLPSVVLPDAKHLIPAITSAATHLQKIARSSPSPPSPPPFSKNAEISDNATDKPSRFESLVLTAPSLQSTVPKSLASNIETYKRIIQMKRDSDTAFDYLRSLIPKPYSSLVEAPLPPPPEAAAVTSSVAASFDDLSGNQELTMCDSLNKVIESEVVRRRPLMDWIAARVRTSRAAISGVDDQGRVRQVAQEKIFARVESCLAEFYELCNSKDGQEIHAKGHKMNKKEKEVERIGWRDFYAAAGVEERTLGEAEKRSKESLRREQEMSGTDWEDLAAMEREKIGMVLDRALVACGDVVPYKVVKKIG